MKYVSIVNTQVRSIDLPDLFGGINLRDGAKRADNQLSDCLNVWCKDGLLRTRPGFDVNDNMKKNIPVGSRQKKGKIKTFSDIRNGEAILISVAIKSKKADSKYAQKVFFLWQDSKAIKSYTVGGPKTTLESEDDYINYFVLQKDGMLYAFYEDGTLQSVSVAAENESTWDDISLSDTYIPTVYIHCKATSNTVYHGTMLEGFNLICDKYKMIYSTVNLDRITTSNPSVPMIYPLPTSSSGVLDKIITVKITSINGLICTHEATFNGNTAEETGLQSDGLRMKAVAGSNITFYSNTDTENPIVATLSESDYLSDNMEIIIPRILSDKDKNKVFGMTQSITFGGAAAGLKGGTRVFLCGNQGSERALVLWSGLDNPLYFNENCSFYVGDKAYSVKAFGKQSDKLIILKENEVYYTYYADNTNITEEDLINQSVMDYESAAVYFPLISLSGYIGCDAPDTVKLCRNRLVWANSDGKVYTLATLNQFSELEIYPISDMIYSRLSEYKKEIPEAVSVDLGGYYALIIGNTSYLCDYDSYGYRHITSYNKSEDANAKIPWYIWELPESGQKYELCDCIAAIDFYHAAGAEYANIYAAVLDPENKGREDKYYRTDGNIVEAGIKSRIATNSFDFGVPERNKRINEINISFADNGGAEMIFEAESDKGTVYSERFSVITTEADKNSPGNIKNKVFRNIAPAASRICIKVSSDSAIAVSSANIKFKYIGGAK